MMNYADTYFPSIAVVNCLDMNRKLKLIIIIK